MKKLLHRHTISVTHAVEGLFWALKTQPNFLIHISLSFLAILGGCIFNISYVEWLVIIIMIIIGMTIELINTAIEATLDVVDRTIREEIKIAKDVSAAAMLIFAFGALLIAGLVFFPKIIFFLRYFLK